ncbi:methionyl-tRNA formyltransferase [Sulfurimonas paralvinellae]|uniref:Methionyl-tRNA formyltransferase n=1 Tax=Sulfurimonas paralvinellae TaxID=317658 RepID=A0A7M1BAQ7_9BACT|nr:methionyl-tRNA formyltransferase [Sulfurimonas paralvinellae]
MDVIFMGTPDYADVILKKLIADSDINVKAVYTQPDKPVGRKKILTPPPVKTTALEHNITVYQPEKLREESVVNELVQIACDYIIVAAYGQILPRAILDHAPCINLHASILPQYRGASPIQQTLLNGDKETGVTAILMEEGLDTGDIIKIEKITVPDAMMLEELFESLTEVAADLTLDIIKNFEVYKLIPQDDTHATHCKKITKADGLIAFDDAQTLFNKYRAFTPWPGIYLKTKLKLKKIELQEKESQNTPGEILAIDKESIVVGCAKGSIRIFRVQPESKKEMDVLAYINGKRLSVADHMS